uniref:Uncharacterized protein n=2 Tax=Panagrolaimus sp. JU765 TaxID=591449 RepID=A0AC34Q5L4_9BILA
MNTRFQNCQFYSSDHNFGFKQYFYELSLFSRGKSQIVIRAFCPNFGDNIGVDSIEVMNETVLRPKRHDGQQNIQVITFDEWIRSKNDTSQIPTVNMRPKVLLVVSKSVENTTETPENEKHFEKDQKNCTKSFCLEDASKENEQNATENLQSKDDSVTKMPTLAENSKTSVEDPKQALANLAQWMSILRNLAPILPVIPSLINSLKNGDSPPTSSAAANFHGNNAYTDPTMPVAEPIFSFKNMAVQRRFPQVPAITPVNQRNPNESLQSFSATSFPSANFKAPMKKDAELLHDLNLSTLTVNELKTLESIHKKIFPIKSENQQKTTMEVGESRRKPLKTQENLVKLRKNSAVAVSTTTNAPIVIFDKPKQVTKSSPVETDSNDSKQFRYLTPEMLRELNMVANMPDLEPLTEGLDLSLLNKPGGFSILKQQFLERLFQKIPLKSEDSDLLLSS